MQVKIKRKEEKRNKKGNRTKQVLCLTPKKWSQGFSIIPLFGILLSVFSGHRDSDRGDLHDFQRTQRRSGTEGNDFPSANGDKGFLITSPTATASAGRQRASAPEIPSNCAAMEHPAGWGKDAIEVQPPFFGVL